MLELNEINISYDMLVYNIPIKKQIINKINHSNNKLIKHFLNMNNDTFKIYNIENPIEWTPIKLCYAVNFLLRTQDEFWLIKYSKIYGLEYNYIMFSKLNNTIFEKQTIVLFIGPHHLSLTTSSMTILTKPALVNFFHFAPLAPVFKSS